MTRFSLIAPTFGRETEPARMLRSLAAQSCKDFELLIIDQNSDDRVPRILDSLAERIRAERIVTSPGLCRAINLGLKTATGEIVAFPDDDCWYPSDLLRNLSELLYAHPEWDGITVPTADDRGVPSIARWAKRPGRLTPSNLGMRGCSTSVFTVGRSVRRSEPSTKRLELPAWSIPVLIWTTCIESCGQDSISSTSHNW